MDPGSRGLGPLPPQSHRWGRPGAGPLTEPGESPATEGSRPARVLELIRLLDLTSLTGRESRDAIRALCARARAPVPGVEVATAAVCVHPPFVSLARESLTGSPVLVATVAGGFPRGEAPLEEKLDEIRTALAAGAEEVDVTVDRGPILVDRMGPLAREVEAFRGAAGSATLKVILGTGELGPADRVARASRTALEAGADFLKTSTGFEATNATLEAGTAMARAVRDFRDRTGEFRGLKPAGGIRTVAQALQWRELVVRELGPEWLHPRRFRIGASALLDDLARAVSGTRHHP